MKFRPCIDLHNGKVVQIVGGSLSDNKKGLQTNFVSSDSASDYAFRYMSDNLRGGHVVSLGSGNTATAIEALSTYPGGMQYGGGVNPDNAADFLKAGASHVIVTSWVFSENKLSERKLKAMRDSVGKDRLVLDLSCRMKNRDFYVVTNRWQSFTEEKVDAALLERLAEYCSEYLVHGVDVEGKRQGIQKDLITTLGQHSPIPVTYAGGVQKLDDLNLVRDLGQDRVDLTIGSALDIFGGKVKYQDVLEWMRKNNT